VGSTFDRTNGSYAESLQTGGDVPGLERWTGEVLRRLERTDLLDLTGQDNVFLAQPQLGAALRQTLRHALSIITRTRTVRPEERMRHKTVVQLALALSSVLLAVLVSACGSGTATPVTTPATAPVATATAGPERGATAEPGSTEQPVEVKDQPSAGQMAEAAANRTPVPSPTPGIIDNKVEQLIDSAGLRGRTFLGLTAEDWVDVIASLVIGIFCYLLAMLGVSLFFSVVRRVVHRTTSKFDDAFLEATKRELKWLAMVLVLRYSVLRLDFWSDGLRTFLDDAFFVLGLLVILVTVLKLINFVASWYWDSLDPDKDKTRLEPIIVIIQRFAYGIVLIVGASAGLSHFGIQVTALAAALIVIALALSLGAKDLISDAISGFVILIDQPFRVGDVIGIEELNKWGDVVDIGTRTTRIRTRDNRLAIVPNSRISASQVINYTFDPTYRVYIDLRVAYGSDFDRVRSAARDAVRGVEGVLLDQPVDVLFHEYGLSARTMRVRWWIADMHMEKLIIDRVNEALEIAFDKAGIEMPVTTRNLMVKVDSETVEQLSPSHGGTLSPGKTSATGDNLDGGETE
jgi:MscS family membrane protein